MSLIKNDDPVCSWWFSHQEYWFNSTHKTDQIVLENLKVYLLDESKYNQLCLLGQILVDDQIVRHYYRENTPENTLKIKEHHQKALTKTHHIIDTFVIDFVRDILPEHICFILLPLRHSEIESNRLEAITLIKKFMLKEKSPFYQRFLKASLIRLRDPELVQIDGIIPWNFICPTFLISNPENKLVLECPNELVPIELINGFKGIPKLINQDYDFVVSISGGSDSMLLLWSAVKLGYRPIALMIDYGNREEHFCEIKLVQWFAQTLNIPFYVRYIKELKRTHNSLNNNPTDLNDREFYEDVTKKIRFSAYTFFGIPVLLGHNWDDCFENCITNILTHRSPDNLLGMSFYSVDSEVEIYRPFLKIKKSNIMKYCCYYGIPYLIDSTPKWSRRGKIRDDIRPPLEKFDKHLTERIVETCQEQSQMTKDYQKLVNILPIKQTNHQKFTFNDPEIRTQLFWILMFKRISNITQTIQIKIKSIKNLIKIIDQKNDQFRKISISKDLTIVLPPTDSSEISIIVI